MIATLAFNDLTIDPYADEKYKPKKLVLAAKYKKSFMYVIRNGTQFFFHLFIKTLRYWCQAKRPNNLTEDEVHDDFSLLIFQFYKDLWINQMLIGAARKYDLFFRKCKTFKIFNT